MAEEILTQNPIEEKDDGNTESNGKATGKVATKPVRGKKSAKVVLSGEAHIQATFNNTIVTITDEHGNTLAWSTAGSKFKGSRKSTPFAAQVAADTAARTAIEKFQLREVTIYISGGSSGREATIRSLSSAGLKVKAIHDVTPIAHNGCREKGRRRV